ncbi:MAG: hypothetical protein MRY72_06375 [Aquisalinus sp.]|nr:hypothetical protein [Aquisalinus sp.]
MADKQKYWFRHTYRPRGQWLFQAYPTTKEGSYLLLVYVLLISLGTFMSIWVLPNVLAFSLILAGMLAGSLWFVRLVWDKTDPDSGKPANSSHTSFSEAERN